MLSRFLVLLAACCAMQGCEKAQSLLGQTRSGRGVGYGEVKPGGATDGTLAAMVSRTGSGVRFRRDLPFPTQLGVWMRVRWDLDQVRVVDQSALGRETNVLSNSVETELSCKKSPGTFQLQLLKAGRAVVMKNADKTPGMDLLAGRADLENQTIAFLLSDKGWRARQESGPVDFKRAVWSEAIEGRIPLVMIEAGAHPRVQWFNSTREWEAGDEISLVAGRLKLIDPFAVSGRVTLRYEGEEAIDGHPCAVFSISGSYSVEERTQADGVSQDAEITVNSGRIWASLLHPVLLREEYDTVQTCDESGGSGGAHRRLFGKIKVTKVRNWEPEDS